MFGNNNLQDLIRYIAGFLFALQLLLNSFGFKFLNNEQIDAVINIISFLFILYFGTKHNYLGKKGQAQKAVLQEAGLEKTNKQTNSD
ncbi:phage holin [Gottfriedia acidiceleris]|uniref:SPP1 phage holin family protein n=1 Tax=Gottfriedia acidiceleris TaxID=371036 RepID=A0ABY4JRQ1_9BACI|nr:phage holin [Gottfriedia acidiceleris]UPM56509.1 SPP1 phage holin family protein [Gottfriedia acidiceleris]